MIKLTPVIGIFQAIARKRGGAEWTRKNGNGQGGAVDQQALLLEREAEDLERHAVADIAVINTIELLIHDLATSSHQSAHRTLAIRDLENASNRLRRELGDPA